MELMRNWIAGVAVTAVLAAVARALTERTSGRGVIRLFCGVCVALALLTPVRRGAFSALRRDFARTHAESSDALRQGQDAAQALSRRYAAAQAEAYLEAQSASVAPGLVFSLTLADDLTPVSVQIRGPAAARGAACALAARTLGLPTEHIAYIVEEKDENGSDSCMDGSRMA